MFENCQDPMSSGTYILCFTLNGPQWQFALLYVYLGGSCRNEIFPHLIQHNAVGNAMLCERLSYKAERHLNGGPSLTNFQAAPGNFCRENDGSWVVFICKYEERRNVIPKNILYLGPRGKYRQSALSVL